MHATYIRILRLISQQHKSLAGIVGNVLVWVTSAGKPLSPEELAVAVAITPGCRQLSDISGKYRSKTVIKACRNFVTVKSNKVRLVHFTVQEFLTSPLTADTLRTEAEAYQLHQNYRVVPKQAHAMLVQHCLQLMRFKEMKDFSPNHYPADYQEVWNPHQYIMLRSRITALQWKFYWKMQQRSTHLVENTTPLCKQPPPKISYECFSATGLSMKVRDMFIHFCFQPYSENYVA